jgi:SagB-type dehydrogenase family enzyme
VRAPGANSRRGAASAGLSARLGHWARIEAHGSGAIVAISHNDSLNLGKFGARAAGCLQDLRTGLPLDLLVAGGPNGDREIDLLYRRLSGYGLLEYFIPRRGSGKGDLVVIEPQAAGYSPQTPPLADADVLVLSRFAYLRRRDNEIVLESPRSGALFRLLGPKLADFLAVLSTPRQVGELRRQDGFPGIELLAALVDCNIVYKANSAAEDEGDQDLALWDFHDLLFHARSTEGRHSNPLGIFPHEGLPQLPALRPSWPGEKIDLLPVLPAGGEEAPAIAKLLRQNRSIRHYNDRKPITLTEVSQFLDGAARGLPRPNASGGADYIRPYPSAGASSELELYLAVHLCDGLAPGFYHYDVAEHSLTPIEAPAKDVQTLLMRGAASMGVTDPPQILIVIAARFGRISWKYRSIAYALILKDAGVLTEALYLMASGMGLGGCAIGVANVSHFEKLTGSGFHAEGPVGQFALGSCPAP